MYSNIVLNIFNNPKNIGRISKPDGIADLYNDDFTQHVEFSLRIESGIITNCQFRAQANPYIIAICSIMTNMVKGKMVSMVFLDPYSIKKELGDETDIDIMFCIDCFKLALQDYKEKLEKTVKQNKEEANDEMNEEAIIMTIEEKEEPIEQKIEEKESTTEDDDDDFFGDDFFEDFFDEEV